MCLLSQSDLKLYQIRTKNYRRRQACVRLSTSQLSQAKNTVAQAEISAIKTAIVAQYICMLFVLDGWPFAILVFMQRKGQVWPYVRKRWPVAAGGAFASIGSYAIALWAMTVAPVAILSGVAALRLG